MLCVQGCSRFVTGIAQQGPEKKGDPKTVLQDYPI